MRLVKSITILLVMSCVPRAAICQSTEVDEFRAELERVQHSLDGFRVELEWATSTSKVPAIIETARDGRYRRSSSDLVWQSNSNLLYRSERYLCTSDPWICVAFVQRARLENGQIPDVATAEAVSYFRGVEWAASGSTARQFIGEQLVANLNGHSLTEFMQHGVVSLEPLGDPPNGMRMLIHPREDNPEKLLLRIDFEENGALHAFEARALAPDEYVLADYVRYGPMEYKEFDGRKVIYRIPFTVADERDSRNGTIRVVSIEPLVDDLGDRVQFMRLVVPNGLVVNHYNDTGIRYEFHDGKVMKIGDAAAVEAARRARFHQPHPWFNIRNAIFVTILAAATGAFIWLRTRAG